MHEIRGARALVRRGAWSAPASWMVAGVFVLLVSAAPRAEVIDRIMAVVAGQPITLSDVNAALQFRLVEPPSGTSDPLALALDRLIERNLMLAEVDRFQPPEPAPIEINLRMQEIEQRSGSAAALTRALAVTGMTPQQLRAHIRDDLRIATYLNQRFGPNAELADRLTAVAAWAAELRRRADVTVQYVAR
jgi:hypothetical protein